MDTPLRNLLKRMTQDARQLLESEFARQLEGVFDILPDGTLPETPGAHLSVADAALRARLIDSIRHRRAKQEESPRESVNAFVRECAFTLLNRFVALKMLEARGLVRECVSKAEESSGLKEFALLAPGLGSLPDKGYRLYLECIFDEIGREVGVLFDRRDPAAQLWPSRPELLRLLGLLNQADLTSVWGEDETIGWVYQYFNLDEERREMRQNQAPQNSREMAVRNQFFTPRYVVEFLTDNTLGRLWYEMRQGKTELVDRCSFLVRRNETVFLAEGAGQPEPKDFETEFISYRAPKDPRDLKILDPACGSGHFLLYCFDLLEIIYQEAWTAGIGQLRADYPALEQLKLQIPRLILQHNLQGVDIDPRAAQIGSLALWMRAQRAWKDLPRTGRPEVRKTNIAIAEPMPGEAELLDEFCVGQPAVLGQLVREVFKKMKLAGYAGTLLRIESDVADIVAEARRQWAAEETPTDRFGNPLLFAKSSQRTIYEVQEVSGDFWETAETRLFDALHDYARRASNGKAFLRRLFADDAERGFAFIDICRQRYDVVLMNPPFGEACAPSQEYINENYGDTKGDVYKAFVEGSWDRLLHGGMLGIISSRMGFFVNQSQDWRERVVLRLYRPMALADLGGSVLDAMVQTAAYTLRKISEREELDLAFALVPDLQALEQAGDKIFSIPKFARQRGGLKRHQAIQELAWLEREKFITPVPGHFKRWEVITNALESVAVPAPVASPLLVCFGLVPIENKQLRLQDAVTALANGHDHSSVFCVKPSAFSLVPGAPFAYWVDDSVRRLFQQFPMFEGNGRTAKVGLQTSDDFRFVRAWWEVQEDSVLTGGPGTTPVEFRQMTFKGKCWVPFAKGGAYSPYYSDIYLVVGWMNDGEELKAWAGLNNSHWSRRVASADYYFRFGLTWPRRTQKGFNLRPFPAGAIFADKGPVLFSDADSQLEALAVGNSSLFRTLLSLQMAFGSYEVGVVQRTPFPLTPEGNKDLARAAETVVSTKLALDSAIETSHAFAMPALMRGAGTLAERAAAWASFVAESGALVSQNQEAIDRVSAQIYGIPAPPTPKTSLESAAVNEDGEDGDSEESAPPETVQSLVQELLSHALGSAFGRWSVNGRDATCRLDPFAPVPPRPPAAEGAAAAGDGILIDEPGHSADIIASIESWFGQAFGTDAARILQEATEILAGRDGDLRRWFATSFFEFHVARYTKKPRKAPIYWQMSVPSRRWSVWLYYHRLTKDSLWRVLKCAEAKVETEERRYSGMLAEVGAAPNAAGRRSIDDQRTFLDELTRFRSEVETIAQVCNPDLNDGVLLNFAPLRNLTPQLPAWQRELEDTWGNLRAGKYDWSHWAMHLWPERVIPKCAVDRSLAIAHGLEPTFWEQQEDGKWKPRKVSAADLKRLIAERTSSAVEDAMVRLTAATPGSRRPGGGGRRRVARSNS